MPLSRKLLFAAILLLVLGLLAEGGARLFEVFSPGPQRDRVLLPKKPEGSFRIMVYGGSTVVGIPLPAYGLRAQLEYWLRQSEPGKVLELLDLAEAGEASDLARERVEASVDQGPDLLIVMAGHNEFLTPKQGFLKASQRYVALVRLAVRVRDELRRRTAPGGVPRSVVLPASIQPWVRGTDAYRERMEIYAENLRTIARMARDRGVPVMFVTLASNERDWPPAHRYLAPGGRRDAAFEERTTSALALLQAGDIDGAQKTVEEIVRSYPGEAMTLYLDGAVRAARGDYEAAHRLFVEAIDADPVPWRAISEVNETIRTIAREEGAILVDVASAIEQEADHGIPGFREFMDNVHPSPFGNAIIARTLLDAMQSHGLFVQRDAGPRDTAERLEGFLSGKYDPDRRRALDKEQLLRAATASMKTPFYNMPVARAYLERAMKMDPSDWEVWANLATVSLFQGRVEEGAEQLKRAVALRGEPIDSTNRKRIPCLHEALEHLTTPVAGVQ